MHILKNIHIFLYIISNIRVFLLQYTTYSISLMGVSHLRLQIHDGLK